MFKNGCTFTMATTHTDIRTPTVVLHPLVEVRWSVFEFWQGGRYTELHIAVLPVLLYV